ncbi:MAG: Rieske 2Fe-2S domain-containing protein [Desulfobacteraceae bacterium]
MKFLKRLLGICETPAPACAAAWSVAGRTVTLDLARLPELTPAGGAVRLEGRGLPQRLLVVRGPDGGLHAFGNRCSHMGRRIDPLPGTDRLECCSLSQSTYSYAGEPLSGAARGALKTFGVSLRGNEVTIVLPSGGVPDQRPDAPNRDLDRRSREEL